MYMYGVAWTAPPSGRNGGRDVLSLWGNAQEGGQLLQQHGFAGIHESSGWDSLHALTLNGHAPHQLRLRLTYIPCTKSFEAASILLNVLGRVISRVLEASYSGVHTCGELSGALIHSKVILVQKPMLLDSLLAFEEVVMQPTLARKGKDGSTRTSVTWRWGGNIMAFVRCWGCL